MRKILLLAVLILICGSAKAEIMFNAGDYFAITGINPAATKAVVFIHGFNGQAESWRVFSKQLGQDYKGKIAVFVISYPSIGSINADELGKMVSDALDKQFAGKAVEVYLVAHSMGGLVLKLANLPAKYYIAKVCYIATPHDGTEIAFAGQLLGGYPAETPEEKTHIQELLKFLTVGYQDTPKLRSISYVIAGTKPYCPEAPNWFPSGMMLTKYVKELLGWDQENDGTVPRCSAQGRKNGPNITSGSRYGEFYLNHSELPGNMDVYKKIFKSFFSFDEIIKPYVTPGTLPKVVNNAVAQKSTLQDLFSEGYRMAQQLADADQNVSSNIEKIEFQETNFIAFQEKFKDDNLNLLKKYPTGKYVYLFFAYNAAKKFWRIDFPKDKKNYANCWNFWQEQFGVWEPWSYGIVIFGRHAQPFLLLKGKLTKTDGSNSAKCHDFEVASKIQNQCGFSEDIVEAARQGVIAYINASGWDCEIGTHLKDYSFLVKVNGQTYVPGYGWYAQVSASWHKPDEQGKDACYGIYFLALKKYDSGWKAIFVNKADKAANVVCHLECAQKLSMPEIVLRALDWSTADEYQKMMFK